MAKRKNYPEEFKRDAVDLVRSSKDRTLTGIAHRELLRGPKAVIGTTVWESRAMARRDVFRWIAEHDNRERIHSTIGYITPYQARLRCRQRLDLAA